MMELTDAIGMTSRTVKPESMTNMIDFICEMQTHHSGQLSTPTYWPERLSEVDLEQLEIPPLDSSLQM